MNLVIQIYMFMCVILLVFDIAFLLTKNITKIKFLESDSKFEKTVRKEIENIQNGEEFSVDFVNTLSKKLSKTKNLVVLQNIMNEYPESKERFKPTLLGLVDTYKQKSDYDQAFYIYVVSTLGYADSVSSDFALQFMSFLDSKSLYTFSNTMDALYAFSDVNLLISAIDKVNEREGFYHKKLLVDGLLSSDVDKQIFVKKLIDRFNSYSIHTKEALLDYFRMTGVDVSGFCMALLSGKSVENEICYACMRYFIKHSDSNSKNYFINTLKTESTDWIKQMLAIQGLKKYNDSEVELLIKNKITDRNWYVRINALEYLVENGLDDDELSDILKMNDKYAIETLLYLFKDDEAKSSLISDVLNNISKTKNIEEVVTV